MAATVTNSKHPGIQSNPFTRHIGIVSRIAFVGTLVLLMTQVQVADASWLSKLCEKVVEHGKDFGEHAKEIMEKLGIEKIVGQLNIPF